MVELWKLVAVVFCSGIGAYLGSYLKKKGENLATHEDIGKVLDEVSAVTRTTKEIEAKISSDVWDRQKRWELKRDVLFETTKNIAVAQDALGSLSSVYSAWKDAKKDSTMEASRVASFTESALAANTKWNEAANRLDQAALLVSLVCGKQVWKPLLTLRTLMRTLTVEISSKGNPEAFMASVKELLTLSDAITAAMRREMEIEETE